MQRCGVGGDGSGSGLAVGHALDVQALDVQALDVQVLDVQVLRVQALGGSARSLKASQTIWSRISRGQPAMSSTKRRRSSANRAREASSKRARLPAMTAMK